MYIRDGEHYLVIASKGGADTHPAWYRNVERRRLYDLQSAVNPGFKEYEVKTKRVIPAVLLERLPG